MRRIDWIVWHTAAHARTEGDGTKTPLDTTAAEIDRWHRSDNGWDGIGYHAVIRFDGTIEWGRPVERAGAHLRGLNRHSLGLCFSGHGDVAPLTPAQYTAGMALTRQWMDAHDVDAAQVIGHREHVDLIERGQLARRFRNPKSCPGFFVDMDAIRFAL